MGVGGTCVGGGAGLGFGGGWMECALTPPPYRMAGSKHLDVLTQPVPPVPPLGLRCSPLASCFPLLSLERLLKNVNTHRL